MANLNERLTMAEALLKKPSFRHNKGLGNEVGYYIFAYSPEEELSVREYDIAIDILQEKGYLEKCYEFEEKRGFERISKAVANTLRITAQDNLIIQYIRERTQDNSVVFLTGIGKCYPLLRSHTVLNNLHQVLDHVPVVMFYPGKYDGQELILFDEIKDDNYYRAFKLVE